MLVFSRLSQLAPQLEQSWVQSSILKVPLFKYLAELTPAFLLYAGNAGVVNQTALPTRDVNRADAARTCVTDITRKNTRKYGETGGDCFQFVGLPSSYEDMLS